MTTGNDAGSLYQSLREHYASMEPTLPRRREILQILELRFTPEEAELALRMPLRGQRGMSLGELESASGESRSQLEDMLGSMLKKGIAFSRQRREDGVETFLLWDLGYSMYTPTYGDGITDDQKRRLADLRERLWQRGWPFVMFNSRHRVERVLPFEEHIDPSAEVVPYERFSHYVEQAQSICVVACGCRASSNRCNRPLYTCIHFDQETPYWVKYRGGRLLSKEECLSLMRDAVKSGLVIMGRNYQAQPNVVCMCCGDDCLLLRPYNESHYPYAFARSNFLADVDRAKCRGCLTCFNNCPVGAIQRRLSYQEGIRDGVLVLEERCIGCGVCTAVCPQQAIMLKKVRDIVPAETIREAWTRTIAERLW